MRLRLVNKRSLIVLFIVMTVVIVNCSVITGVDKKPLFPGETWLQYVNPEDAEYSPEKLAEAKEISEKNGSDAVMVIYDGAVLVAWGDVDRRFECHSVRKSLLNALYGIYVDNGTINLDKNLADLGITDNGRLTTEEKTARISDLLKSRSGVYIPAAKVGEISEWDLLYFGV